MFTTLKSFTIPMLGYAAFLLFDVENPLMLDEAEVVGKKAMLDITAADDDSILLHKEPMV